MKLKKASEILEFEVIVDNFSLKDSLLCGQCFRFEILSENEFLVFANNHSAYIKQIGNVLVFKKSDCALSFWENYFDLKTDYLEILGNFDGDEILKRAKNIYSGIHIFKQDPWETLISFIISANNNIPRIKKILKSLCENFGVKNNNGYSFPSAKELIDCKAEDLKVLKLGFREKYVLDAIFKVNSGEVNLKEIYNMNLEDSRKSLTKILGVGKKISECVLLYGYHKMEAFPIDIWMKRVLEEYYCNGLSKEVRSCPGLAQQILYYCKRDGKI